MHGTEAVNIMQPNVYPNAMSIPRFTLPNAMTVPYMLPCVRTVSFPLVYLYAFVASSILYIAALLPSLSPASSASAISALRFKKLKYVCHPIAITPANMLLYCGSIKVKLNAVTAGQSLQLLIIDVGTVRLILSQTCESESPERKLCMPKK